MDGNTSSRGNGRGEFLPLARFDGRGLRKRNGGPRGPRRSRQVGPPLGNIAWRGLTAADFGVQTSDLLQPRGRSN